MLAVIMVPYKGSVKLGSADNIFAALEDSGITLSAMRKSRYAAIFLPTIKAWDARLAAVSELLELLLAVRFGFFFLTSGFKA